MSAIIFIKFVITPVSVIVILKRTSIVDHKKEEERTLLLAPKEDNKDDFSPWYTDSSIEQELESSNLVVMLKST